MQKEDGSIQFNILFSRYWLNNYSPVAVTVIVTV
jgi:hypothetical protein